MGFFLMKIDISLIFAETILRKKMYKTKNVYLDEVYNFYFEHFSKYCVLTEINAKNRFKNQFFMVSQ